MRKMILHHAVKSLCCSPSATRQPNVSSGYVLQKEECNKHCLLTLALGLPLKTLAVEG